MHRIEMRRLIFRHFTADDWRDFEQFAIDWLAVPGPAFDKCSISERSELCMLTNTNPDIA